jgi:hypothetical protein
MRAAECVLAAAIVAASAQSAAESPALPQRLADTGLYAPGSATDVQAGNLPFTPQYPLWSDGATKRRWLHIPAGKWIDGSRPDEWNFPTGTKLWKEFSHGRRIETRMVERLEDGSWRFAAYVWNEQGTEATLAPQAGVPALPVKDSPGGRYTIPGETDCRACHEGAAVPVLGVGALQLSPDRDPLAPHAEARKAGDVDLRGLIERGWLRNVPARMLQDLPRIAADTPDARAALGYLHGNCGHCHNDNGSPPPVDLVLAQSASGGAASASKVLRSLLSVGTRYRARGTHASRALEPGKPEESLLIARMRSRNPQTQMPPLGTHVADIQALALIERWIRSQPQTRKEPSP